MTDLPDRSRPRRQWPGTRNFGTLLRDPALAANELVTDLLAGRGFGDLRPSHTAIAQHIEDSGSRVTDLAQRSQLTKPSVVYIVNDLERLGYVERVPDPADGRAKLVRFTTRGVQAQEAGREIVAQIERDWSQLLGERDFATLRELLQRLHDALWPPSGSEPR
jgi:DNA-binding MarR family transcriptional regulator